MDRIEIGDGERPGDQRARARAAARTDGNVVGLGPFDEVRDDQEVARIVHAVDDVDLEGEPLLIVLFGGALRQAVHLRAACASPSSAWRFSSAASSAAASEPEPAPTVKRGRIGLRVIGRNEQRSAISTVDASASGMSANSTAISARVLKR